MRVATDGIEIISRDHHVRLPRRGPRAPQATQVAERFHLVLNLRGATGTQSAARIPHGRRYTHGTVRHAEGKLVRLIDPAEETCMKNDSGRHLASERAERPHWITGTDRPAGTGGVFSDT